MSIGNALSQCMEHELLFFFRVATSAVTIPYGNGRISFHFRHEDVISESAEKSSL
jgi:hypothetical protein